MHVDVVFTKARNLHPEDMSALVLDEREEIVEEKGLGALAAGDRIR